MTIKTLLAALLQTPAAPPVEAPPLRAIRQLPARMEGRGAVVLRAQRIAGQPQGELRLQGDAELRHGDTLLKAPSLLYDTRSDQVSSPETVRMFIAARDGGRKGDLSRFIEEAVRAYLLESAVDQAKTASADMNEIELNDLIDEAVQWAREH